MQFIFYYQINSDLYNQLTTSCFIEYCWYNMYVVCFHQLAPLIATLSPSCWHVTSRDTWRDCTCPVSRESRVLYCTVLYCTCPVSRETRGTRQNIRSLTLTVAAPESVTWLLGTYQVSIWCFWRDNWFKSWLKCCKLYLSTEETHTYLDI